MMNENINESLENIVALDDNELEAVTGGKKYITGDSGNSYVHPIPDKNSPRLGVLHKGEDVRYLGNKSTDNRGVVWYMIRWKGQEAWVSSMYTRKISY